VNKAQVRGSAKYFVGKVQTEAGKLVGSTEQQAKGIKPEIEGIAQKDLGDENQSLKFNQHDWWERWA
jgi:uncharacterized protein YjbJ (UPF0337 family)